MNYPSAESTLSAAGGLRTVSEQLTYLLFLFTSALFAGRKMAAAERIYQWLEFPAALRKGLVGKECK